MKLLTSLLAGDTAAFEKLCSIYSETVRSMVKAFIARNPSSSHLKDDLISEGVLAVVNTLRTLQETQESPEDLKLYMGTAIWHGFLLGVENEQTIRSPLKKRKYYKSEFEKVKQSPHELNEIADREYADLNELMDSLNAACRNDTEQMVIGMRSEGMSDRQIAHATGYSESTVCRMRQRVEQRFHEGNS